MRKILVATDFSERSDRAIRRATLLAKDLAGSLSLVHVIDDDQPRRLVKAEQQVASDLLAEHARTLQDVDSVDCAFRVVLGEPFEGITQAADEEDVDLVVIGPHRRQALKDVFVGTTAERTIRASNRPVLMANGIPTGRYRRVLIAVDLSACSGDAAQAVRELGLEEKVAVSVVHVFDAPASGLMRRASSTDDQIKDYIADEKERASGELKTFLDQVGLNPVQEMLTPAEASVANTICAVADNVPAELVVVGTHGRTGVGKLFLGSVAEEVLRIADRDVLAVSPRRKR